MTWYVDTEHPIAVDSLDHLYPHGTAQDYHKSGNFNSALYKLFDHKVSLLDLGCAGGGLTESLIADGHESVGLEGSDYSLIRKRAAWATIPNNLFTCDITKPFVVHQGDHESCLFDVVSAWDVMEHILTEDLPYVCENIKRHLKPMGYFLMTTTPKNSRIKRNINLHRTVQNREWWVGFIESCGFVLQPDLEVYFKNRWYRRVGKISLGFRMK